MTHICARQMGGGWSHNNSFPTSQQHPVHYRNPGGHYPHVFWRPFLVFTDGSRSLPQGKLGDIRLNQLKKAQIVHKSAYLASEMNVRLVILSFPLCSGRPWEPRNSSNSTQHTLDLVLPFAALLKGSTCLHVCKNEAAIKIKGFMILQCSKENAVSFMWCC